MSKHRSYALHASHTLALLVLLSACTLTGMPISNLGTSTAPNPLPSATDSSLPQPSPSASATVSPQPSPSSTANPRRPLRFSLPLRDLSAQAGIESPTFATVRLETIESVGESDFGGVSAGASETLFSGKLDQLPELLNLSSDSRFGQADWSLEVILWGGSDSAVCNFGRFSTKGQLEAAGPDLIALQTDAAHSGSGPVLAKPLSDDLTDFATLIGTVRDAQGQLIPKARFELFSNNSSVIVTRSIEAVDGSYFLHRLPAGVSLTVRADADGYETKSQILSLVAEKDQNCRNEVSNRFNFVLTAKP